MGELPASGTYVCKCGNTFTVSDERAQRAEAVISSVRALLEEFHNATPARRNVIVRDALAALEPSGTPGPIERSREQARAEVELVQRWWLRDAQGWRTRMAGPQAAQEAKARGLAGTPPEELTVCWDFESRPSSSRMFDAPPFSGIEGADHG